MVGAAWAGAEDADAILLVVDAADLTQQPQSPGARDTETILAGLKNVTGKKMALVLNKIDGMKRTDLLPLVEKFHAQGIFEDVFLVSALKRRRRRRRGRTGWRRACRRAPGSIRKTRPPIFPCASGRRDHAGENLSSPA